MPFRKVLLLLVVFSFLLFSCGSPLRAYYSPLTKCFYLVDDNARIERVWINNPSDTLSQVFLTSKQRSYACIDSIVSQCKERTYIYVCADNGNKLYYKIKVPIHDSLSDAVKLKPYWVNDRYR